MSNGKNCAVGKLFANSILNHNVRPANHLMNKMKK